METVKGPLVYSEWTHNDAGDHVLILQADFYCYKGWTCALVDENGKKIEGNRVEIKEIPVRERPAKQAKAEATVFYKMLKDLSMHDELETVKLERNIGGEWKDYAVKDPGLKEVRLELYDWACYRFGEIYKALEQHHFSEEKYIKLADLEAEIERHIYDTETYERFKELYRDLAVYTFKKEKYLKLSDLDMPMAHIRGHATVIVGSGG